MHILADLKMFGRFASGLRSFICHTITLEDAMRMVRQLLSERERNFLRLVERGIFGYPQSPYLPLLKIAGCEFGDIRNMVGSRGLEQTLLALRDAGVYVSFEEIKARQPILRGGRVFKVSERSFDNPFLRPHYFAETGGSTGAGTRVSHELDHLAVISAHELITYSAHGVVDIPKVVWRGVLPDGSGINNILRLSRWGRPPQKWFSPFNPYDVAPAVVKYRLATLFTIVLARLAGARLPWPKLATVDQAGVVVDWVAQALREKGACLVLAPASRALRVSLAARSAGIALTGATFRIAGEPITSAKIRGIERSGARVFTTYGFAELGRVGMGCSRRIDASEVHLCESMCAMISYGRNVPSARITVPAFNFTSLLPTAPKILLNAESDDYGLVEQRSCGCPLDELGLKRHLREIRSFQKLTGEGVSLVASDMIHVLEEVLPSRFGGSPLDYQLMEEEDKDGLTRITLLIHPRLSIRDDKEIIDVVMKALRKSSAMAAAAGSIWNQAGAIQVRREKPIWTERGKLMSLYVNRH
ncbi:MAG: hypothetical protein WCA08_02645 [Desulfoferrobacter sp.]